MQMEAEVDSLSLMVSELLELSRIETGRVPLHMSPISPMELITQSVERLRLQAERADLELTVHCTEDLPLLVVDNSKLEQVIVNLLHNAVKFTPPGGKIAIGAKIDGKEILFSVQDSGIGISVDELPRIFERFYKTDPARSSGGTGLGLAIARHIVESHGGKIWV